MAQRKSSNHLSPPAKSPGQERKPPQIAASAGLCVGAATSTALHALVCLMARSAAKDWLRGGGAWASAELANGSLDGLPAIADGCPNDDEGDR